MLTRIAAKDSKNVNTAFLHNNEHSIDEVLVSTGRLFRNVRVQTVRYCMLNWLGCFRYSNGHGSHNPSLLFTGMIAQVGTPSQ